MTKVKNFFATILGLAVLTVAAVAIIPQFGGASRKSEEGKIVTVSVVFTPTKRNNCPIQGRDLADSVAIQLRVGSDHFPLMRECESPWSITVYPRRGEVVEVRAEQLYGVDISCRIIQLGAPPVQQDKFGPAIVTCRHTTI